MIRHPLVWLDRHAAGLLALGLLIGLALPRLAQLLHPTLAPLVFLLAAATLLRVDWPAVRVHSRRPGRIAVILAWSLAVSPVVTALILAGFGAPKGLGQAIVIWSACPPLISSPALAFLLDLDGSLALILMIAGSLLMPLILPPIVLGLLGIHLALGIGALMLRLIAFIGGALLLAGLLRRIIGRARLPQLAAEINGCNVVLLLVFAIAIMDGVPEIALRNPGRLALYLAAALSAALGQQLLATLVFLRLGRVPAMTIGMLCGNRNLASVWASLGSYATPDLTLYFVAIQLPIYLLPALLKPFYRRFAAAPGRRVDSSG